MARQIPKNVVGSNEYLLTIRWTPGYIEIPGNVDSDRRTAKAAVRDDIVPCHHMGGLNEHMTLSSRSDGQG